MSTFAHDHVFNVFDGNVVVYGLMSVLMEFVVVVVYLTVGWFTDASPVSQPGAGVATRPWKGNLFPAGGPQGNESGGGRWVEGRRGDGRGGLIHMAVAAAREGVDTRRTGDGRV